MERKASNMMNEHVPDVARLFVEELKMDLREADIEARVSKYFMDFDRLVDDQGLSTWRIKARCKLSINILLPDVLGVDVERFVTHREAKTSDVILYDLIVERVVSHQHYHRMQAETKKGIHVKDKVRRNQIDGTRQQETLQK
ncbi:hypothetical protein PInf_004358 [Phytophthora infestans]|nr:hypothetical protein PInf_004358 [Phytophthora infestans]